MKKLILVAVLLLTVSTLSFGQSAVANVTANVNGTLSIANTGALALGNVPLNGTVTILSTQAGAATFTVTGAVLAATTINVTFPSNLVFSGNDLPFTGQIPRYNTVAVQGTSTAFGALTGGSTTSSAGGNLWLWVGGGVTAGASQTVGQYTGTITVGVTQP